MVYLFLVFVVVFCVCFCMVVHVCVCAHVCVCVRAWCFALIDVILKENPAAVLGWGPAVDRGSPEWWHYE